MYEYISLSLVEVGEAEGGLRHDYVWQLTQHGTLAHDNGAQGGAVIR